ncbi:ribonuclease activity regulator RraA [Xylophilus sp.]|uniref:ribonuclease activity regulator RraA n=1 Tax=Xylophilus sp. TaxID=2653893 RepID=UPI0013B68D53|nr:ribonuclease activity regulator RraA [Xylophilus sp.]KAF1048568.1 MAG: 4-hydroxy-4-methyl-2-oxoglutarate aldolase/4-carboxy-4-hydroxy-2-oxoadipate aldolase [Xylophilus sp.]
MDHPQTTEALAPEIVRTLCGITTATISTILFKAGLRNVWLRGPMPLRQGQPRVAGRAFTLRFIPMRDDLASPQAWSSPKSTRVAVEQMPAGCVAVVDAMGVVDAGIFGDILCARMRHRGVAGLVSDGVVRDVSGVLASQLPTWTQGTAAPAAVASLHFVGWQEPVACGGVAVFPGDIVVADDDGAILISPAHLDEVLAAGPEQERLEAWILEEVHRGAALPGLYPPNDEARARYEARAAQPRGG